jgi:PEGA domain
LTIQSSISDCKVLVNGQLRGTTDIKGVLTLPPLKADRYRILLRKENYEEQAHTVQVTAGVETSETFTLTPLKGSLTIVPVPSGARVTVRGMDYPEGVRNLPLEPGSYNVSVSKEGYKTVERNATIEPGQPLSLSVILEVLRVEEMLAQGQDKFRQRDYAQAIAISRDILSAKPEEPKANLLLGMSHFNYGNYDAAVASLLKAISLGEQVQIPVQRHTKFGMLAENDNLTPGVLIIGKNLLEFRAATGTAAFSVPFDKVYRVIQEDNRGGRVQIKVGNPAKKKDGGKDYNFHPIQAGLRQVMMGTSRAIAIYCQNCLPVTQAIYQIVQQAKSSSETGTPKL